ncbi:MAG: acetyl-CoA synthetase [bacterium]
MIDPRSPCVIGVAQRTIHPGQGDAPEPLDLWEEMCRAAADDSGGGEVLASVDSLQVIYSLSWQYDDPPARLAERLGLRAGARHYTGLSGTSPQKRIQAAAAEILAGRSDLAVTVGAESLATRKRLRKSGEDPAWSFRPEQDPPMPFDEPFHPAEIAHRMSQAYLTFAVFDIARRAHLGLSCDEHRDRLGERFAAMSRIAAANPNAWFREEHSAAEIVDVTAGNRMVAYPYPKHTIAIMDVDMAAAVMIASHEKADGLGVPQDRRIYLRGFCEARDPVYVAERGDLWRSLAMEEASAAALSSAGVGIDDIAHLDLYSCFGSSIEFAADALGLTANDPRPLTVTGGLPFHGGPGNNYMTHAVVSMVQKLREDSTALGMVSGVGMHMTNHVFAVYSAEPGRVEPPDQNAVQMRVDAVPRRAIRNTATGPARVAAYSVVHSREGPERGLVVCDLPEGDRCYARVDGLQLMRNMEETEWVGRDVELLEDGEGINRVGA